MSIRISSHKAMSFILLLALLLGCHVKEGGATTTSEGNTCRFVDVGNGWCTSSESSVNGASQKYAKTAGNGRSGIATESACRDACDADQACTAYNYFPCGGPLTCGCFIYVPSKSSGPAGWNWHAAYQWTSNLVIDKGSGSGSTTCITCERNMSTGTTTNVSTTPTTLPGYEIYENPAICLFAVEEQCNSFQMCMDGCDTDPNCKYFVFTPLQGPLDYCYLADTCQVLSQGGSSIYKQKPNRGANTSGGSPQTVTLTGSLTVTVPSPQTFIGDATAKKAVGKALAGILEAETPSCIRVSAELAGSRRLDSRRLSGSVKVDYAITIPSSSDTQKVSTALSTKSGSDITTAIQEKLTGEKVGYSVTVDSSATLSGATATTATTTSTAGGTSLVTVTKTGSTRQRPQPRQQPLSLSIYVPTVQGQVELTVVSATLFISDPNVLTGVKKGIAEMAGVHEMHVEARLCAPGGVCVGHVRRLSASGNARRLGESVTVHYSISVPTSAGTSASAVYGKMQNADTAQAQSIMSSSLASAGTALSITVTAHSANLITATTTAAATTTITVTARQSGYYDPPASASSRPSASCSRALMLLLLLGVCVWKFEGAV